jgi:hypothetical protein
MAKQLAVVLLLCLAYVQAQISGTFVDHGTTINIMTSSTGAECGSSHNPEGKVVCDGGLERSLEPGHVATNAIPAVENVMLKYAGAMPQKAYISLIDTQYDCATYAHLTTPDNLNSAIQQADENSTITIPQHDGGGNQVLLTSTQNGQEQKYKLCYSCNNGVSGSNDVSTCDLSSGTHHWQDSGIRVHISRLDSVTAYNVVHKTEGTIPNHADLHITYIGQIDTEKWLSFVDDTLNGNFPCDSGIVAADTADSSHSGAIRAYSGTKEFNFPSDQLSADKRFAVCYAEAGGLTSSQWRDSGIRVRRSAIVSADYGVAEKFGLGFSKTTWNRNSNRLNNADLDISSDKLPRSLDFALEVQGVFGVSSSLPASASISVSLVDASLMNSNPCSYPQIATADPSIFNYEGSSDPTASDGGMFAANRRHFTGIHSVDSTGLVVFNLGATGLLDHDTADCSSPPCDYSSATEHVYALCYSMGTDSDRPSLTDNTDGWSDTYLRYTLTDIEAIKHHGVFHGTNGQLPQSISDQGPDAGPGDIVLEYHAASSETATPAVGFAPAASTRPDNRLFFIQDPTYTPANQVSSDPCGGIHLISDPSNSDATLSGVVDPEDDNTFFTLDTSQLQTGTYDPSTNHLTKDYFAVCYTRNYDSLSMAAGKWFDTGIRLTISKINSIRYGNVHGAVHYGSSSMHEQRVMYPNWRQATSSPSMVTSYASWDGSTYQQNSDTGQSRAHNVISQEPDQVIEYQTASLGDNRWISLVDATLNGGTDGDGNMWSKPCAYMEASKLADQSHSGVMQAGITDSLVTVQQNVPLSEDTLFAVCYAVQTGTNADFTWDDTYIRVRVSQVSSITSVGVVHEVYNDDKYVATIANRGAEMLDITYSGTLAAGSKLSLVDELTATGTPRWGNSMVCEEHGSTNEGMTASGVLSPKNLVTGNPDPSSKTVLLTTSTLNSSKTFAVCYEAPSGQWHDTGIRVRRSEFSSVRFYNLYEAPAAREQTSIFKSTNRIPQIEGTNIPLKYVAEAAPSFDVSGYTATTNGRYVSLVGVHSSNGQNPCTTDGVVTVVGNSNEKMSSTSIKSLTTTSSTPDDCSTLTNAINTECGEWTHDQTSGLLLDASLTYALCYCNTCDGTNDELKRWYDSYIRFDISKVANIQHMVGKWGDDAGIQLTHWASGQIPNTKPTIEWQGLATQGMSNTNQDIQYTGHGLAIDTQISLVEWQTNPSQQYGIDYYSPCADQALWVDSSLYTAVSAESGTSVGGSIPDLDTTGLDTDRTFALCYQSSSSLATPWTDSGIRLTVPKLINVQRNSIHSGIEPRSQTAVFRPTNRLPQSEVGGAGRTGVQLKYLGALAASQFVRLIKVVNDNDENRNPCVKESHLTANASTVNSGVIQANADNLFEVPTANLLEHAAVVAVCYTDGTALDAVPVHQYQPDGVTPMNDGTSCTGCTGLPFQNTRWRDSYIRLQITKVSALKVANLVTTTDGQIPNTHAGMYFQYLGELGAGNFISLVKHDTTPRNSDNSPCFAAADTADADHSGSKQAASTGAYAYGTTDLDTTILDLDAPFALCYSEDGTTWLDSGIRLSLPKVYSIEAPSGYAGGSDNCQFIGGDPTFLFDQSNAAYTGSCKKDTMARQQTSMPLSTNRLQQKAGSNEVLRYVGGLPAGATVSIVKAASNPNIEWDGSTIGSSSFSNGQCLEGNSSHLGSDTTPCMQGSSPCVSYTTEALESGYHTASMPLVATDKEFELPSSVEFEDGVTVAVCYLDPAATTPLKWRDSLIRLKVSRVGGFMVSVPALVVGTNTGATTETKMTIKTIGQIPRQHANAQVEYEYFGTSSTNDAFELALVEDMQDVTARSGGSPLINRTDSGPDHFKQDLVTTHGFEIHHPCENYDDTVRSATQQKLGAAVAFRTKDLDTFNSYMDADNDGYYDGSSASPALASHDGQLRGSGSSYDAPLGNEVAHHAIRYALCYKTSGWSDSGLRVTISQLDEMQYRDGLAERMYVNQNPDFVSSTGLPSTTGQFKVMLDHTTRMDSTYSSTNQIPQLTADSGLMLTYGRWVTDASSDADNAYMRSDLIGSSYISIVDATLNNNNPCVDPAHAAHSSDTQHSGPITAARISGDSSIYGRTMKINQNLSPTQQLETTATYAACYSDSPIISAKGSTTDVYWRDSFIRFTISEVESVVSYQVTHRTIGGQIANHELLKLNYVGSLPAGNAISLVQTDYTGSYITDLQSHFPCATKTIAAGAADPARSGTSTLGVAHSTINGSYGVVIDTHSLNTTGSFAVCYHRSTSDTWADSGIRVSLPKLYKFAYRSRYWSADLNEGTANRDFSSYAQTDGYELVDTPTNRLPRSATLGALLSFQDGVHSTALGDIDGTERLSIVRVHSTINSEDPCTDPVIADPGHSSVMGASSGSDSSSLYYNGTTTPPSVEVNGQLGDQPYVVQPYESVLTQEASLLLGSNTPAQDEVFALCYTTGGGGVDDRFWRDSYVRIKMTKVNSLIVAGQRHFTQGHIPYTAASDDMRFYYDFQGSLGVQNYISLVDATLSSGLPCAGAEPAVGSGAADNWYYIDGVSNGFTPQNQPHLKNWANKTTHSGPHRAATSEAYVQGLDTRFLNKSSSFALCYGSLRSGGAGDWYDSGIRLTVSRVAAAEYKSSSNGSPNGPTKFMCSYVNSTDPHVQASCDTNNDGNYAETCVTRAPCDPEKPFNGGCGMDDGALCQPKLDTAPRIMTSATKAFNRLPGIPNVDLKIVSDLPANTEFSLVNHHVAPADIDSSNYFQFPSQQVSTDEVVSGSFNPCIFPTIAAADAQASIPPDPNNLTPATPTDQRAYSGVFQSDAQGYVTIPQSDNNRLDTHLGNLYALCYKDPDTNKWQDAFLRFKMSRVAALQVVTPSLVIGTGTNTAAESTTDILTTGQLTNQATYDNQQQVSFRVYGASTSVSNLDGVPAKIALAWIPDTLTDDPNQVHYSDKQTANRTGTALGDQNDQHNWGMEYLDPCQEYGYLNQQLDLNPAERLDSQTVSNEEAGTLHSVGATLRYKTFGLLDLSALDSDKTYAVCYADSSTGDHTLDDLYTDSGIRVTLPRLTELDYTATDWPHVDRTRHERTRTMSDWLLPTNVLPQVHNIMLQYFHSSDSSKGLDSNGWISIVQASVSSSGKPACADHSVVEAASSSSTGAVQSAGVVCSGDPDCASSVHPDSVCSAGVCTGGRVTVPQTTLLDPDALFAVCYAKSSVGDVNTIDFTTWRDSYIRLSISQIQDISAYSVVHETTGQVANHRQLPLSVSKTSLSNVLDSIYFVHDRLSSPDSRMFNSGTHFPCTKGVPGSSASTADLASNASPLNCDSTGSSCQTTIDTRYLQTYTADGGVADANIRNDASTSLACWNNTDGVANSRCIGSTNWGHRSYAVCYKRTDSRYFDTGIRLTVSQVATLMYESGHVQTSPSITYPFGGSMSSQDTTARYMSASQLAINTIPVTIRNDTTLWWKRDQGTNLASTDTLPIGATHFALKSVSTDNAIDADPCARPASTCSAATCITNTGTSSPSYSLANRAVDAAAYIMFDKSDTVLLDQDATFAVCYSGGTNSTSDYAWRDSYVRLKVSKISTFGALLVTHKTFGQIPSVKIGENAKFHFTGAMDSSYSISLVAANKNNNFPCSSSTEAAHSADSEHSGAVAVVCSGDGNCEADGLVTSTLSMTTNLAGSPVRDIMVENDAADPNYYYDTTNKTLMDQYYALCYGSVATSFYDSGIRVTTPSLTQIDRTSEYTGTPTRTITSFPLVTNKIPPGKFTLIYSTPNAASGGLGAGGFMSLVATTGDSVNNMNNPCVDPTDASLAYDDSSSSTRQSSGAGIPASSLSDNFGGTGDGRLFDHSGAGLLWGSSTPSVYEYAVCYSSSTGDLTDMSWRDSYIRLQISEVEWFGTKGLQHRTSGNLPYHKAGLVYEMGTSTSSTFGHTGGWLTLIDEQSNEGLITPPTFSNSFYQPCNSLTSTAGSEVVSSDNTVTTLDTLGMNTSKTYAVCYSIDPSINARDYLSKDLMWLDSGIRVTISSMWGAQFSGYSRQETELRGHRYRTLTSTVPELQPALGGITDELVSHVLPKYDSQRSMHLVYTGDLAESQWIGVVEWTDPCESNMADHTESSNNLGECTTFTKSEDNNPCSKLNTAPGTFWAGRSCYSADRGWAGHPLINSCDYYTGASQSGNKEVDFDSSHTLDSSKQYTFCYSAAGGGTPGSGASLWYDSFIRFSVSDVDSLTASQLNPAPQFTDHGELGIYESTVKLKMAFTHSSATVADGWVALVDETITTSQHPCTGDLFWSGQFGPVPEAVVTAITIDDSKLLSSNSESASSNSFRFGNTIWGQTTLVVTSLSGTPTLGDTFTVGSSSQTFKVIGIQNNDIHVVRWDTDDALQFSDYHTLPTGAISTVVATSGWTASVASSGWSEFPRADIVRVSSPDVDSVRTQHKLFLSSMQGEFAANEAITTWSGDASGFMFEAAVQFADYHFQNDLVRPYGASAQCIGSTTAWTSQYICETRGTNSPFGADTGVWTGTASGYDASGQYEQCQNQVVLWTSSANWQRLNGGSVVSATLEDCRNECDYAQGCVAFMYDDAATTCSLYSVCDTPTAAGVTTTLLFVKQNIVPPSTTTYVGAKANSNVVELETEFMDTTKQYVACFKEDFGALWTDTGIRFTVSKLHTLSYNSQETPLEQFRLDFTTSRAKVGQPTCLSIGASPESICGPNADELCQLGSICDPDRGQRFSTYFVTNSDGVATIEENRNGGCGMLNGTVMGQCASALGPVKYVCLGPATSAFPPEAITCSSNSECQAHDPASQCEASGALRNAFGQVVTPGTGTCMLNDEALVRYTECDPDAASNSATGCGTDGKCVLKHSATVYNHVNKNILPLPLSGETTSVILFDSDLRDGLSANEISSVVLLESGGNHGRPCLLAEASSTSRISVAADGKIEIPRDSYQFSTEYTVCYNGTGVGFGSHSTHGVQWFDSFIRLKFSEITSVTHHGAVHTVQGHVANTDAFGLTVNGWLADAKYIALTEETQNSFGPCSPSSPASSANSTGIQQLDNNQSVFDTTTLNTRKNYAVCYYDSPNAGGTDSGIRVTVGTMNSLGYNWGQYSDYIPERRYERLMYSTNVAPTGCTTTTCASDTDPAATNRLPVPGGNRTGRFDLEFSGSQSLSNAQVMVLVDSSRNNNNPCMNFTEMGKSVYHGYNTGPSQSNLSMYSHARRFAVDENIMLEATVSTYTTCYCNLIDLESDGSNNGVDYQTCRDSYIHMKPTVVQTITAYGQEHRTTGQVASRALTVLAVDKGLQSLFPDSSAGMLEFRDETLNNYHPCQVNITNSQPGDTSGQFANQGDGSVHLKTDSLEASRTYAVCYSVNGGQVFEDSGLRLTVPKITAITYSKPVRDLRADTCFISSQAVAGGIADCNPGYNSLPVKTSRRNSQLPQSHKIQFAFNSDPSTPSSEGSLIRLVDHELGYNDPCRTGATASGSVDRRQQTDANTTTGFDYVADLATGDLLDFDKTFAVCYSTSTNLDLDDINWRDSFIRITWSSINILKIHHQDNFDITTKGLIPAVPQLRVEWALSSLSMPEGDNSNHYSPWIRLTAEDQNSNYPCEASNAGQVVGSNSTAKVQVLDPANEFVVLDTSMLGDSTGSHSFAVCAATGDGSTADTTWEDSGIRVRVVKWANSAKSRVASGAPSMLYFDLNTGDFVTSNGKVALVAYDTNGDEVSGCATAKDALQETNPYYSTGNAVMRKIDYRCKAVGSDADSTCDAGGSFHAADDVRLDRCIVDALCTPGGSNAGGCGNSGGECSAAIQLPTGKTYTGLRENHVGGVWQDDPVVELALQAGSYSMCVCDDLTGDGGCDDSNEWTVVFNHDDTVVNPLDPDTVFGGNLQIVSKPRLGRDSSHLGDVRHLQNRSYQYSIRASDNKTGYNVQDDDKIYFAPAGQGCAQESFWSGNPAAWRTMPTAVCTSMGSTPQATCDTDLDGRFEETCELNARCTNWVSELGGCGTGGTCESPRVNVNQLDQTAPILLRNLTGDTASFITPADHGQFLSTPQTMVACYATRQSEDYTQLEDTLSVIVSPQVGPGNTSRVHVNQGTTLATTTIRALEGTSPVFKVDSLAAGDLIYFMPRTQPPADSQVDCTPYLCSTSSGSLIGSSCDSDYDGLFNDKCTQWAACDPNQANNGGCGTAGVCERRIPTVNSVSFTKPLEATSVTGNAGLIQLPADTPLTTAGAANDTSCTDGLGGETGGTRIPMATSKCQPGSAKYFVTCFIPKGAVVQVDNVERLSEDLTILIEPTAGLDSSYEQGRIYNLDFTSPQQGDYNRPENKEFSTGLPGDCVVLTQASDCSQAYSVSSDSYFLDVQFIDGTYQEQHRSMKMSLDEADVDTLTMGDTKGGVASTRALAEGKVNELPAGTYNICYATMNSECDHAADFSMLTKQIEILPRSATGATLMVHKTVQLGHDIQVDWSSNKGLSSQDMIGETWVGLFDKDACLDTYPQTDRHKCKPLGGRQQPIAYRALKSVKMLGGTCQSDEDCHPQVWKEKCQGHHDPTDETCASGRHMSLCLKKTGQAEGTCTGGIDSGRLRFSQSEYLQAGEYDVRIFQGDSRNKNGIFCGGMQNTPHETYNQCVYESSVSASLLVYSGHDNVVDLNALPGMEMVWSNGRKISAKAPQIRRLD